MKHVPQHDQSWLDKASPAEIAVASRAGALAELQGQPVPIDVAAAVTTGEQLSRDDLDAVAAGADRVPAASRQPDNEARQAMVTAH